MPQTLPLAEHAYSSEESKPLVLAETDTGGEPQAPSARSSGQKGSAVFVLCFTVMFIDHETSLSISSSESDFWK